MSALREKTRASDASESAPFDMRQRLALLGNGGRFSLEELREMRDKDLSADYLLMNGVRARELLVARVSPQTLVARGMAASASSMRTFGFDALHLIDPPFCAACVAAFGAENVVEHFMVAAHDAVALAGTTSASQLGLTSDRLLRACAGAPIQASSVLQQLRASGVGLKGVKPETLLDTALRSGALTALGYTARIVAEETKASPKQLEKLGW